MWEFATKNPFEALLIVAIIAWAATRPFSYAFRAYNRRLRSQNIVAHGWPPEHLDADGNAIEHDNE